MVEYQQSLDSIFGSLADPTRRDILRRVFKKELTVGEIAKHYELTFAAIAKHLTVLEKAGLIGKKRRGKEQVVSILPKALIEADQYLKNYQEIWEERISRLEQLINKEKKNAKTRTQG
jgi:DNA-binding transcriptional ArsR family regulator